MVTKLTNQRFSNNPMEHARAIYDNSVNHALSIGVLAKNIDAARLNGNDAALRYWSDTLEAYCSLLMKNDSIGVSDHPKVKAALEILGGEVVEIKRRYRT